VTFEIDPQRLGFISRIKCENLLAKILENEIAFAKGAA
jgi:hypothetical protein